MADPTRWLTADEAAGYLRLSVDGFRRKVRAGAIPAPSAALGAACPRWDRLALDAAMGGGVASTDPRQAIEALAQTIASSPRRAGRQGAAR
jgi:hypothetical protein